MTGNATVTAVYRQEGAEEDFEYSVANGEVTITGYHGDGGHVVVPATLAGLLVTRIGEFAFMDVGTLTGIVFPDSLRRIQDAAFAGCSKLNTIAFGNGLTHVADIAFWGCSALETITLPDSLTVETFFMDATEVTKAQWDAVYTCAIANGYSFDNAGAGKEANHPVHTVDWFDCVKWCNARSQKEGRTPCYTVGGATYKTGSYGENDSGVVDCNLAANGYRLPTDTEWEYAARGGLSGSRFPWGNTINHNFANYYCAGYSYDSGPWGYHPTYATDGTPYTSPVGSFAANGYGLYDMAGNLWEWCNDSAVSYQYRFARGGSWLGDASNARCGGRGWRSPADTDDGFGFRAVCR